MIAVRVKTPRTFIWIADLIADAAERIKTVAPTITATRTLAVVFVAAIFYIGYVTFPTTLVNTGNYLKDAKMDFAKARDTIDASYTGMLAFTGNPIQHKGAYINIYGYMSRAMGQRWVNSRALLDNGNIADVTGNLSSANRKKTVASILQLYNAQKERGKYYLLVVAPDKVSKFNPGLPVGVTDSYNKNWDTIIADVTAEGVPVLDLRDLAEQEGLDYASLHFKTDHHWNNETGFWAYTKIIERLKADIGINVDSLYTDKNSFDMKTYSDWFLGSDGKRVGSTYVGVDDFTIIYPKFETAMTIKIASAKVDKTGNFYDVAYNHDANLKDYFNRNPYGADGWGDRDYITYRSESAPIDMKIMTNGDSYTNCSLTLLPLVFKTYDELDMRHYKGDFAKYYADYAPDIVITLASGFGDNVTYDYFPVK